MTDVALILAAHGSRHDAGLLEDVRALARRLASRGPFTEVLAAFHHGEPSFADALTATAAPRVIVVPIMAADGWYAQVVLPRELRRSPRFEAAAVQITPALGLHPQLASLVEQRAVELLRLGRGDPSRTTLIVVGHGTPRHPKSSASTFTLAERLRGRGVCADVRPAFLDEAPGVAEVAAAVGDRDLLVIPFLISNGPHAARDIPAALGIPETINPTWPLLAEVSGRRILCDAAIGADPRIEQLVFDLALTAVADAVPKARIPRTFRLGTRGSAMARWQANLVAGLLRGRRALVDIVELSTPGDRDQASAIVDLPGDAPFADDIEAALRGGEIDLAVHCLKDLPARATPGLRLAAFLPRQDAREALVSRDGKRLADLPPGALVGTSSPRRAAQLRRLRPDLRVATIRGPVESRVAQVEHGRFDAAILALAGLERLGLADRTSELFTELAMLPAPGQGVLVVQAREDDDTALTLAAPLHDPATQRAADAEWALQAAFDADRAVTVAALATCGATGPVYLRGRLLSEDGDAAWDAEAEGDTPRAAAALVTRRLHAARQASTSEAMT